MYRIMCEWCGDIIIGKRKRFCCRLCQNRYFANNKSEETRKKLSDATAKNYRDGSKTHIIEEYQIIANEIYEYKCCGCGKTEGKLMVHHIDGYHDNNSPDNLVWLCFGCHNKAHPNRPKGDSSVDEEFTELIIENRELNRR